MQARGAQMQADAVAYAGLQSALRPNLELATAGVIDGVQRQAIDPLAHTRDLAPISVRGLSNAGSNGKPLSDHFGLAVDLTKSHSVGRNPAPHVGRRRRLSPPEPVH